MTAAAIAAAAVSVTITVGAWIAIIVTEHSQQIDREISELIMSTPLPDEEFE